MLLCAYFEITGLENPLKTAILFFILFYLPMHICALFACFSSCCPSLFILSLQTICLFSYLFFRPSVGRSRGWLLEF